MCYLDSVHGGDKVIRKVCERFQIVKCLLMICDSYDSVSKSLAR